MGEANNSSFTNFFMCYKRTLNFGSAHSMTRNVNHIINPPSYPIVAIRISLTPISSKIITFKIRKIGPHKSFMISKYCSHLTRPTIFYTKNTFCLCCINFQPCFGINNNWLNSKKWYSARAWFCCNGTR